METPFYSAGVSFLIILNASKLKFGEILIKYFLQNTYASAY